MKKAYPVICVFLAALLIVSLWSLHFLRNNRRSSLVPSPLPPSDKVMSIDINTADIDELCCLPGIGEVLAKRIIDYREEHGDFTHIRQIRNVNGIGAKTYEQIAPYLTIGGRQ